MNILPPDMRLVRMTTGDSPLLMNVSPSIEGNLAIYTLNDMPTLHDLLEERRRYAALISGLTISIAMALTLLVLYLRRERQHLIRTLAKNAALEHEVKYDGLTGSLSRGHFIKQLRSELAKASVTGSPAALILVDLDHFKGINDTWGHAAGDAVLTAFVHTCQSTLRGNDTCGRLGGEEFAIIFSDATEQAAFEAAERLRIAVLNTQVIVDGRAIHFTVSAGIAQWQAGEDETAWLRRADAALYFAKSHGRNRSVRNSVVHPSPEVHRHARTST